MIREARPEVDMRWRYPCPCCRRRIRQRTTDTAAIGELIDHVKRYHPELIVRRSAGGRVQVCSIAAPG